MLIGMVLRSAEPKNESRDATRPVPPCLARSARWLHYRAEPNFKHSTENLKKISKELRANQRDLSIFKKVSKPTSLDFRATWPRISYRRKKYVFHVYHHVYHIVIKFAASPF